MKKSEAFVSKVYSVVGDVVMTIAVNLTVRPASILGFYQPKLPKCIK